MGRMTFQELFDSHATNERTIPVKTADGFTFKLTGNIKGKVDDTSLETLASFQEEKVKVSAPKYQTKKGRSGKPYDYYSPESLSKMLEEEGAMISPTKSATLKVDEIAPVTMEDFFPVNDTHNQETGIPLPQPSDRAKKLADELAKRRNGKKAVK